jgi:zinc D-Ala-D-Ala carboxypeptidase
MTLDWKQYPSFTQAEMACKHTKKTGVTHEFMVKLQKLRNEYGKPMSVTSGFRDATHPVEARKSSPGAHTSGMAVDIAVGPGEDVHRLVQLALLHGFTGVGVSQRQGQPRFVHLDILPRKAIWSY